ncbi:trigger factor [Neisseria gonorrhoeae]|uniref:Trigger factor n=1 Tax=Neisseria gonorrhoeae TaxID=485 RepID=A0A378VXP9_NEIGO|nr:trigger factor [Neisseria gonorrhoeae]
MPRTWIAFGYVQRTSRTSRIFGSDLAKLVDENKLEPTEEQIKAVVANFAESYEDPQEVIDWYYADTSRLQAPTSLAVESNVVDFVWAKPK